MAKNTVKRTGKGIPGFDIGLYMAQLYAPSKKRVNACLIFTGTDEQFEQFKKVLCKFYEKHKV